MTMPKSKKSKIGMSLIERMFAELIPEVEFVDVTPKIGGDIAGGARRQLEKRLKRPIVSRKNHLQGRRHKKLGGR